MRRILNLAVASAVVTVVSASLGFGQTSKGILTGVLRDQTGAVVPNATITAKNQETGESRVVTSRADGAYRVEAITPGKYTIVTTANGFSTAKVTDITVVSTAVTTYDISLSLGTTSTEISVEANQGTVNAEDGQLTGTIGSYEINKLPIFSLNPIELATTVAGVQTVSNNGGFSNYFNIQVNGARPRANNFLLDGQEINDVGLGGQSFQPQIPDIFDSVNVITNSASAEYGRAGGGIVNLTTKHGTNAFHGSVFERYTGSGLNSVPGGYRGSDFVKTRFDQHSYGFTAGGPIIKDKLFAFGALELQRFYGQETPNVNLLPDAAGYATLQTLTGTAATQVALLDSYLSKGAYLNTDLSYGGATPLNIGAQPGCATNPCLVSVAGFQRPNQAAKNPDTQWMYRIDYQPWSRDNFSFRYLHDRNSDSPDFGNNGNALAGFDTEVGGPTELGGGTWTHIFSSNLLNEFRASEARLGFAFAPTAETSANPLNSLPSIEFQSGLLSGTTTAGTVNFPTLGPNQNFPQGRKEDLYQFQDTVAYSHGRHSLRMGADVGRLIEIDLVSQNALGTLNFVKGGTGTTSLGNFLLNQLGPSGTATKTFGQTRVDSHGWRSGIFAQDDIKMTPDLTVTVGVRYDYLSNPENSLPYPGLDVSNLTAPINTVTKVANDKNNIAPRIGFAYSPHAGGLLGNGKTVLRGGFGIFYDSTFSNILVNAAQSSPNAVSGTLVQTTGNGLTNATGLIPSISPLLNPQSSVLSEDSRLVNPLTYQYNLGIERELPGQNVLAVRYIGNRGDKLFANQQYNYFSGATGARLNPARGAINARGNYASSNYNSAIVEFSHNFSHQFTVHANYVFSKDLDNGSEIFTTFSSSTSYSANLAPGGRAQENAPSAYDHRQYFSVSYAWSPKGLHSDKKLTDVLYLVATRGWTVSGVSQLQSGAYQTFSTNGLDINGDGSTSNDRPIIGNYAAPLGTVGIDGVYLGLDQGTYYDLGQANTTGNVAIVTPSQVHFIVPYGPNNEFLSRAIGRNSYQLPGNTTHNLALEKGFDLAPAHFERGALILRAEAQNVFNHNDNTIGDTDVLDASAGFLGTARATTGNSENRNIILWAKFQF